MIYNAIIAKKFGERNIDDGTKQLVWEEVESRTL